MKKVFLFIPALLLTIFMLHGQNVDVKLSPEFKLPKKKAYRGHVYSDNTGHYVYFYNSESRKDVSILLEKYSPEFKFLFGKEFKVDKDDIYTLGMRYLGEDIAWLLSERNKKDDYVSYSLVPITLEGEASKPITLAKMKYERKRDIPSVNWAVSADTTKLMFAAYSDNNKDDLKVDLFINVMNKDFTSVWSNQFKMAYSEEQVSVDSWATGNDGKVYLLAKVYEGKRTKETKKKKSKKGGSTKVAAYKMSIFQFAPGMESPKEFELKLGEKFVRGATIQMTPQGDLAAVGFFANDNKGLTHGTFLMKLNGETGEVLMAKRKEFSAKELAFMGKENTKKKKGDEGLQSRFIFQDFVIKDDGRAFVTAEENFSVTRTVSDGRGNFITYTVYYSRDIIVVTFSPDGSTENVRMISKNQEGSSSFFQGYVALSGADKSYFFYNENRKNLKKPIGEKSKPFSNFKNAVSVMTTINSNGKIERTPLFRAKDVESLFVPKFSSPIDKKKLFFITNKFNLLGKNKFRMGTIEIE